MDTNPYVLIVDDMADAADTFAMLLERWGYDAEAHYSGSSALAAACRRWPAIVLLDIGMAPMNGLQFLTQLRKSHRGAQTAIVAISGHTSEALQSCARDAGIGHYLIKPADLSVLKALLKQLIAEQQSAICATEPEGSLSIVSLSEFATC